MPDAILAPLQLTADDPLASGINAMHLKYRLGDVETDCRNHLHAWLLYPGCINSNHTHGTHMPVEEPSIAS